MTQALRCTPNPLAAPTPIGPGPSQLLHCDRLPACLEAGGDPRAHPASRCWQTACWPAAAPPASSARQQGQEQSPGVSRLGRSGRPASPPEAPHSGPSSARRGHAHAATRRPGLRGQAAGNPCACAHLPHPHLQRPKLQLRRQILWRLVAIRPRQHCSAGREVHRNTALAPRDASHTPQAERWCRFSPRRRAAVRQPPEHALAPPLSRQLTAALGSTCGGSSLRHSAQPQTPTCDKRLVAHDLLRLKPPHHPRVDEQTPPLGHGHKVGQLAQGAHCKGGGAGRGRHVCQRRTYEQAWRPAAPAPRLPERQGPSIASLACPSAAPPHHQGQGGGPLPKTPEQQLLTALHEPAPLVRQHHSKPPTRALVDQLEHEPAGRAHERRLAGWPESAAPSQCRQLLLRSARRRAWSALGMQTHLYLGSKICRGTLSVGTLALVSVMSGSKNGEALLSPAAAADCCAYRSDHFPMPASSAAAAVAAVCAVEP